MKSIKQKLMAYVSLICLVLVGLVFLFAQFLLEPAYLGATRRDLAGKVNKFAAIIEENGLMDATGRNFHEAVLREGNPLIEDGECLDISYGRTLAYVGGLDRIARCALHYEHIESNWTKWIEKRSENNLLVLRLREQTRDEGNLTAEVEGLNATSQLVVGRYLEDEDTVLLMSTSLERIGHAVNVLKRQRMWVGCLLLVVSLLTALVFAHWFTRPIEALSAAARRIAGGDYDVQVPVTLKDEIGQLTEDFNTMAREVARSDAVQKDLIANVSHDLRTPLTLIKGYAETIRDLNGDDKAKRDAQLDIIISEADRLGGLVGSVMELSRLDAGTEKFQPVRFDISDFCEELSYRYEDICEKNGYRLQLEAPGERIITADPDLISRVLHNLISNAIAHVGEDGMILLRVLDGPAGTVTVEVEGPGAGIAKDELPHVFKRYYRARQANGKPGAGLGLSIVRAILITHRFPFGVRSTVGAGSTFWFSAPAEGAAPPSPPKASPARSIFTGGRPPFSQPK